MKTGAPPEAGFVIDVDALSTSRVMWCTCHFTLMSRLHDECGLSSRLDHNQFEDVGVIELAEEGLPYLNSLKTLSYVAAKTGIA